MKTNRLVVFVPVFLFLMHYSNCLLAQKITFSFPALPESKARIYYFRGNDTDSIRFDLDARGNSEISLPDKYKGMVRLSIDESGSVEFIGGEPSLSVVSGATHIARDNVKFPDSEENAFLFYYFTQKGENLKRRNWIQMGLQLYRDDSHFYKLLEKEKQKIEEQESVIDTRLRTGDLYASGFLQTILLVEDMNYVLNTGDTSKLRAINDFLHEEMDWEALYTSGNFWETVQYFYIYLFKNHKPGSTSNETELEYANNVISFFERAENPVRTALFESIYNQCEALGWDTAKDSIFSYLTSNVVEIRPRSEYLKRLIAGYNTRPGNVAPGIVGLPDELRGKTRLLIFYSSDCANCETELEELKKSYDNLKAKGVEVISISADYDKKMYEYYSRDFPWQYALCDFEGHESENFKSYGVMGTPTIFIIDERGIIIGKYSRLYDTGIL